MVSHVEYAPRAVLRSEKRWDRRTDGRTDRRTPGRCIALTAVYAASVTTTITITTRRTRDKKVLPRWPTRYALLPSSFIWRSDLDA